MKGLFFIIFCLLTLTTNGQSIVGTWQLVDQTTCLENEMEDFDDDTESLIDDMKNMSDGTHNIIQFKDNQTGGENVRIIGKRRGTKMDNFLYKHDGNKLYLLDKKSRLLIGSYEVETLTSDSLVFSNIKRACEVRVFVRIQESK